jgi:hypothetical protein
MEYSFKELSMHFLGKKLVWKDEPRLCERFHSRVKGGHRILEIKYGGVLMFGLKRRKRQGKLGPIEFTYLRKNRAR